MAFPGPFQPKTFHDTKTNKSECLVHLPRAGSSALHLPELKESHSSRSGTERCDQHWGLLGDSLGVTAALRIISGTCQPICGYSTRDFGSFTALCISLWKHSVLVVWHFNCFHLELSHEFLIRKTLLGRGVERQNRGPEWPWDWKMREKWQSLWESWELYQREPQEIMKIGNIVRRDSLCGSHCSLTLSWLKQTGENLNLSCSCLRSNLRNDAKGSRGRAEFCGERFVRREASPQMEQPVENLADGSRLYHQENSYSALNFYKNTA